MNYLATLGAIWEPGEFKRAALLFDQIIMEKSGSTADRLAEMGAIHKDSSTLLRDAIYSPEASEATKRDESLKQIAVAYEAINSEQSVKTLQEKLLAAPLERDRTLDAHLEKHGLLFRGLIDAYARIRAQYIGRILTDDVVVPLLSSSESMGSLARTTSRRANVVHVVLRALPLPTDETPWEAISDWRADATAVEQYRQLRVWIARMARADIPLGDVAEELAAAMATYDRYMALQHKKLTRGRVVAFLVPVAQAVEALATFRLSAAAGTLLRIFDQEVALLDAEMRAPGRELAFVAAARKRFN